LWLEKATEDADLMAELTSVANDPEAIRDRFYQELAFGTGGLRGVIGAGENRMNIYTVRKATQGLANYLNERYATSSVAISYDSRIKSDYFAVEAARVLAANGCTVYLFPQLEPTPVLSYTVRYYGCQAGIMVTASHNPAKYNGYKCYGADGCQMTDADASAVTAYIRALDIFEDIKVTTGMDVVPVLATKAAIVKAIGKIYSNANVGNVINEVEGQFQGEEDDALAVVHAENILDFVNGWLTQFFKFIINRCLRLIFKYFLISFYLPRFFV
jgi:phosphomannomutase